MGLVLNIFGYSWMIGWIGDGSKGETYAESVTSGYY